MEILDLQGKIIISADSRSILQSLNSPWYQCVIKHEIEKWIQTKSIHRIYWIKIHIGIVRNEKADSLPKAATEKNESIMVISMEVRQSHGLNQGLKMWLFKIGIKEGKTDWKLGVLLGLCPKSISRDAWVIFT
ncbi:hypothetical protein AVEN_250604-1 [Araneus ventricosus]|uniref:Uncharacterized protein n=1 Tax=Araneus ventricosus TaxID=182803 RepID=A0A4Y2KA03_ARAVE|nr:hypothetical protein AVEN_250604-1 [Araneus ventricosus]